MKPLDKYPISDYNNTIIRFRTVGGNTMKNRNIDKRLFEFNSIIKENDDLYRGVAKALGLSDCAFWILYALREDNAVLTQSEICYALYQPKQTVNSALKKLESDGYIELLYINDRRSKQIHLTEKGIELAERTVDKVIAVEHNALSCLSDTEQEAFISLFRKYTDLLRDKMQAFDSNK